jgi:hypothetical protein
MKQFYHFSVLLLTSSLLFGCSKSTKEQAPIIQNQLSSDTNFIKVVNLEQELNNYILMLAESKGLTIQEFKNKIQTLNDKDLHSTKESKFLNEYIGNENVLYLTEYAKTYSIIWSKLNKKYNYISMQSIDEACKQLYAKRYNSITGISSSISSVKTNSIISVNKVNDCGWRFSLCMAAAGAGAILCHVGCIGGTAGLGTPACVLICATLEAAAGVACIDNYCPLP